MSKCLRDNCTASAANGKTYRGLCLKCYSSAKKLVDADKTSWEELEAMGLAEGKPDEFTTEFLKRKAPDASDDQ